MAISGISNMSASVLGNSGSYSGGKASKPTWDGKKAYTYLEDMNTAGLEYGAKATKYYASQTAQDGELSVEDLKKQIKEQFPEYTLTSSEPKNVTQGKHYLYIDDSQMKKMASDPAYRAKVYGLMDREYTVGREYTLTYSDGQKKTMHITGSIFSLSEANRKYAGADGVPYLGSCTSDAGFSSSQSHLQVRSQSFLYDNIDPAKSAKKSRTAVTKALTERLTKKREEKKKLAKKEAKKANQEKLEEKREAKREEDEEFMEEFLLAGSRFDAQA